jgi:hypothetical protein
MEIINLGAAEGLPRADWAAVVEGLDAGAAPGPGSGELAHDVVGNRQRGRQPSCDCGRRPLA